MGGGAMGFAREDLDQGEQPVSRGWDEGKDRMVEAHLGPREARAVV